MGGEPDARPSLRTARPLLLVVDADPERLDRIETELERSFGVDFRVRGELNAPDLNVASRIEGKAPGGGVAIGPGTKALLPGAVTQSLGLLDLKGKAEPLEVYHLLALRARPAADSAPGE